MADERRRSRGRARATKLVSLPRPEPRPDPDVIGLLEDLLERARRGELASIAYVAGTTDHAIATGWTIGLEGRLFDLVGGTAELQRRLLVETG